jgi:hypothetical protein
VFSLSSVEVVEFHVTDVFGLLLCSITLEGTVERDRKRLLFELTPTTLLSEKICNPLDGENTFWSQ